MICLSAKAQSTFVNHRLNFVGGNASTTITVGTNVLARTVNTLGKNLSGGSVTITYPGVTPFTLDMADPGSQQTLTSPFLGPCTIQYSLQGTAGAAAVLLVQYDAVNVTLPAQGVVVQPAGAGASISFQTSTNLVNWSAAASGVYPATGQNRFFRMGLAIQ